MSFFLVSVVLLFPYLFTKGQDNEDQLLLLQNNEDQLLLLQKNGGVYEIILLDLQDNSTQRVVRSKHEIVAFDYHLARNYVFWATRTNIYRNVLLPTENSKAVQESVVEVGSVGGLAVDWAHDRLYWSDTAAAQLEVSRLNGMARQVLYRDGWPSSIVVDPLLGKIFWLDNNPSLGKIRYSQLDGSYPRRGGVWQSAPVLWQAGHLGLRSQLTLDTPAQELYFTQMEGNGGTVMAVDYRLKRIRVAVRCWGLGQGFAVSDSKLYMSNGSAVCWNRDGIFKSNFTNDIFRHTKQMKLLSARQQPPVPDKCDSYSCSHECFVVDDTPSCSCLFGFKLLADNVTCSEQGYVILFSASSIYRTTLPSSESDDPYPRIQLIFKSLHPDITAVDVHVELNSIFWSNNKDAIYRVLVDKQAEPAVVVNCTAKDLSVDWIHNHLYWTDGSRVHMSSMCGKLQTVVAEDPNKPFSIVVDPINRLLFWSTCGWENMIMKAGLDGSNRTKLVSANISCATSLSVDSGRQRLYWVDRTHGTSSSIYYDGQIRHNVHDPRVQTVTVFTDKILWTSSSDQWLFINQSSWSKEIFIGFEPRGVAVFNSISQPEGSNYCKGTLCGGLCTPGQHPRDTSCLCPLGQLLADDNTTCLSSQPMALAGSPLEVLDYNSTSVTLFCDHFFEAERYDITIEVLSSFQTGYEEFQRIKFVAVALPTTLSGLQPATTYSVTMEPHPTYLGVLHTEVSTPPPPQEVTRLPQVYKPWDASPVPWVDTDTDTDYNYTDSALWQPLISEYFLLMFPLSDQHQKRGVDSVIQPRPLYDRIKQHLMDMDILEKFVLVKHYKNKMEFDKDPEMHLTNTPFEVEFFLAMVQVSDYNGGYGVDIILSEKARILWPS